MGCAHIHTPHFIEVLKQHANEVKVKCGGTRTPAGQATRRRAERAGGDEPGRDLVRPTDQGGGDLLADRPPRAADPRGGQVHEQIYAEKPLGFGAADAYEMAKAIDDSGVMFQTGYFMRGDPKLQFLKEQVDKGAFGTITRIRGSNTHSGGARRLVRPRMAMDGRSQAGRRRRLRRPGHPLAGPHSLAHPSPRHPRTATISMGTARYPDCDELGEGLFTFDNGTIASLAAGWDDVSNPVTLEICGTEGHAVIMNDKLYFKSKHVPGSDDNKPWTKLPAQEPIPLEQFIAALNGKKVPLISADEAAYRSAVMKRSTRAPAKRPGRAHAAPAVSPLD